MTAIVVETIGCDVSDKKSELFILTGEGRTERPEAIRTTREGYRKFFQQRPRAHVIDRGGTALQVDKRSASKARAPGDGSKSTEGEAHLGERFEDGPDRRELLARLGKADVQVCSHRYSTAARERRRIWQRPRRGRRWSLAERNL